MHYRLDDLIRDCLWAPDPCVPPEDARAPSEPATPTPADGALPFRAPRRDFYRRRPLRLRERLADTMATHYLTRHATDG